MTKRALFYPLFAVMIAAVGSCSYGWRPDTADVCPQCRLGFAVSQPRWITADSTNPSGYCWSSADPTEYTVGLDGPDLHFQLSVPPGGMVEIYEHTSLDDYRHIPFRLVALEAIAGEHRATGQGEAAKRLFRKQAYWYALKITES